MADFHRSHTFDGCGHFVQAEQPDRYAGLVTAFTLANHHLDRKGTAS